MFHTSHLSKQERMFRSRLKKIIFSSSFMKGSLSIHARTCGNTKCKCYKGEKHKSTYLAFYIDDKPKKIYIPSHLEATVKSWISNYRTIENLLESISQESCKRLINKKEKKMKPANTSSRCFKK